MVTILYVTVNIEIKKKLISYMQLYENESMSLRVNMLGMMWP